jgi:uncharacterized iron-regulated membrane protein
MKRKNSIRIFFTDFHLWLGIASGLVLFIVCFTGTILTFEQEIVEWANSERYKVSVPANAKVMSIDQLIVLTEQRLKGKVTGIEIPKKKNDVYRFTVKEKLDKKEGDRKLNGIHEPSAKNGSMPLGVKPGPSGGGGGGGKTYLVNPYTAAVTGTTKSATSAFFSTVMGLHRWLLLQDGGGKIVVGVATIIFVLLIISGLVIWWPLNLKNWKQGFQIKFSANWKRINHDLHNTLGFYSFLVLLIMSLTGLCWSFAWYRTGVSNLLGDEVFKQRKEQPLPSDPTNAGAKPSLAVLISATDQAFPYEGNYRLRFPADSAGSYVINKTRSGFFVHTAADKIQFDQYSGAVLKKERFSDKPFNEQLAASVRSLHLGDIYGAFSKIIYFLACLFATSLPVTGTIIWINKLKKKNRKRITNKNRVQLLRRHRVDRPEHPGFPLPKPAIDKV